MKGMEIRLARRADAQLLNAALGSLSDSLGDRHRASDAAILAAGFGPSPAFRALLAEAEGAVVGVAMFSPIYSTTRGMAGAYVSDLWVSGALRGLRLGSCLLREVHATAQALWGAGFLRLAVHDANPRARAFYDRLGFVPTTGEACLTLSGVALAALAARADPEARATGARDTRDAQTGDNEAS